MKQLHSIFTCSAFLQLCLYLPHGVKGVSALMMFIILYTQYQCGKDYIISCHITLKQKTVNDCTGTLDVCRKAVFSYDIANLSLPKWHNFLDNRKTLTYQGTFLNHEIITPWERSHFKIHTCSTLHYNNTMFHFRNL
jgi:hypothetical protein